MCEINSKYGLCNCNGRLLCNWVSSACKSSVRKSGVTSKYFVCVNVCIMLVL